MDFARAITVNLVSGCRLAVHFCVRKRLHGVTLLVVQYSYLLPLSIEIQPLNFFMVLCIAYYIAMDIYLQCQIPCMYTMNTLRFPI